MLWLDEIRYNSVQEVGGKNASLGELIRSLSSKGIEVPFGFVIPVATYKEFIEHNSLKDKIKALLAQCDISNVESLSRCGLKIRVLIKSGEFPESTTLKIFDYYKKLSAKYKQDFTDVAVRSSATTEDLPDASFAGQQETYLNVRTEQGLIEAIRNCFASLFTDRAISYRSHFGFDAFDCGLSVCVQKMVRSDLATSGVAFSIDTETGFKNAVVISAAYGLGEAIVQGSVSPDEYIVFKPALEKDYQPIIEKKLGEKQTKMVYATDPDKRTKTISVEEKYRKKFCLSDENVLQLSKWVLEIEKHYSKLHDRWCPMDIEWAQDGFTGQLYIVQARPETVHSQKDPSKITEYSIHDQDRSSKIIVKGIAVGDKIGSGKVRILFNLDGRDGSTDGKTFEPGEVLVTEMTDPDWEPIMKKASAIITNKGGRTCHAAIVARELGIPAIVGTGNGTTILENGGIVTVSCAEGDVGYVYQGSLAFEEKTTDLKDIPQTNIPIMLNVGSPEIAFGLHNLPQKGVGLAREEFIINHFIQTHPLALLRHKTLNDKPLSENIEKLILGFENEEDFFIQKLSFGISKIAAAFYPNPVIVRFSDFKTNEYANLLGGSHFEPTEENPMIGWRGASRYYSKEYKEAFGLECKAIRNVREKIGLDNVVVMIPFCRTVEECKRVLSVMKEFGLERGKKGLKVFLMAELPSNILMAEEFAQHIDGFSIGSNDLTQLCLGLDRDSSLVAHLYDERNPAVKKMISSLIKTAHKLGVKVGICGQGPSDFPDFAQFLVQEGIDSISVTPDSLLKTARAIASIEKDLKLQM